MNYKTFVKNTKVTFHGQVCMNPANVSARYDTSGARTRDAVC